MLRNILPKLSGISSRLSCSWLNAAKPALTVANAQKAPNNTKAIKYIVFIESEDKYSVVDLLEKLFVQ